MSIASTSGRDTRQRREHVWSLRKNGKQVDCELRFHGESYGWECQCLHDRELGVGQRYVMKEGALGKAGTQRRRLVAEGWAVPVTSLPPTD